MVRFLLPRCVLYVNILVPNIKINLSRAQKIINKDPPFTKKIKVCIDKKSISCHARIFSPNRLISEVWNNKLLHYFLSICKLNKKRTNKNLSRLIKETIQIKWVKTVHCKHVSGGFRHSLKTGGEGRGGRDEGGPKEERCTKTLKNVLNCDLPLLIWRKNVKHMFIKILAGSKSSAWLHLKRK